MNMQQMQDAWQQLDARLTQSLRLNLALFRENKLARTRTALGRFAVFPVLDLLFGLAVALPTGSYLFQHWAEWRLALPAVILLAAANALWGMSVSQLVLAARVDAGASVAANQKVLTQLRASRIRTVKWSLLLAPLVGFSALLVGARGLLQFDIALHFNPAWVWGNYLFGVLFVPLGMVAARWLSGRLGDSRLRRVCDDIAGRNLAAARRYLDELAELETSPA